MGPTLNLISEIQKQLELEIPISKKIGFDLTELQLDQAVAKLPIEPNSNHKGTLFGGSQYSGCALICYSLFLFGVRSQGYTTKNIVVSEATMKYFKPVSGDCFLRATWESVAAREVFFDHLDRKGKARVWLLAHILDASGLILSEFRGTFVVFREDEHQ